jgi:signal transduction histidine kinase
MSLLRRHPEDAQLWTQSQAAIHAMSRLNATLLAYARNGTHAPVLVDLGEIVRHTLKVLGRIVPPEINVELEIAEQLPPIQGVRAELEQLVLNLVINACDAMPKGGDLNIALRRSPGSVLVLEISDTGDGIVPPMRNGRTHSTKRPGAGLGLGIVQAVVDRHRGAITIAPREDGGTRAVVMFPTTRSHAVHEPRRD